MAGIPFRRAGRWRQSRIDYKAAPVFHEEVTRE
jgi:hypothetical protein